MHARRSLIVAVALLWSIAPVDGPAPSPQGGEDRAAGTTLACQADPPWCDADGDGHCRAPFGSDCDDGDASVHPGAAERPNLADDDCDGFGDEPPVGFEREGQTMQGAGSAVEWYGDYVYLAAASVLQVYHAPPDGTPVRLDHEIEFRDWVREMAVSGQTLFVAARGDGLHAFDLAADPAHPRPAGRVTGVFEAGGHGRIEAVFNGVHAASGRVAVARANSAPKAAGGADAIVFDYDRTGERFVPVRVVGTEARAKTVSEIPISVALTEDGRGLYIGYGVLVGELAYVRVDSPAARIVHGDFGAVMDIAPVADAAYVAVTALGLPGAEVGMLRRVTMDDGVLRDRSIVSHRGSAAGMTVDVDGDSLCFATWSPGRYEDGYNLWTFAGVRGATPRRTGAAGSLDWVYQIACRRADADTDRVYVADEWGGLEIWHARRNGRAGALSLDLDRDRFATGALSVDLWRDGDRVYSAKEGAGLWYFDEPAPGVERTAVEWIDRRDPGCACEGCCPPERGAWPFPPAVFVTAGASSHGRVALFAHDRNTAVGGDGYFMVFEPSGGGESYRCVHSEPVDASPLGANSVVADGDLVFVATSRPAVRVYQHCPERSDAIRFLTELALPVQGIDLSVADVAVLGDRLLVAVVHDAPLSGPDRGAVHVLRWTAPGDLTACPGTPTLPGAPETIGSFAEDLIPRRLMLDPRRGQLLLGALTKPTFPIVEGGVYAYDIGTLSGDGVQAADQHRRDLTPDARRRVTHASVHDIQLDGDTMYVVDADNGLYRYAFGGQDYDAFYPAHRGTEAQAFEPVLVQSPAGVVPVHYPVAAARSPSGRVFVQEHVSGRVAILREVAARTERATLYLPIAGGGAIDARVDDGAIPGGTPRRSR